LSSGSAVRRDPDGRRRVIVRAAVELVAEVGLGNVTHRQIARRAGVPLGSTTYYFPSLDDLLVTALREATDLCVAELDGWWSELQAGSRPIDTLVELVERYLDDRTRALLEYELYLAAARSPELRVFARVWIDGMRDVLAPVMGAGTAAAVAALIDGMILQALVTGEPVDGERLRDGLTRLLG
jgi:TetR/AcrR family transcriptional regulator, regulator of biofilm formation and stress response